jgi:hypothetical protein
MTFYEYCELRKLDLSKLSQSSIDGLGACYLESIEITKDDVKKLSDIDSGSISIDDSLLKTFEKARTYAANV